MGRKLGLLLLFSFLSTAACDRGFDRPLTDTELKPYQACAVVDDCVLTVNAPSSCCSIGGFGGNVVAVAKTQLEAFRDAFEEPSCGGAACPAIAYEGPDLDPEFVKNKFPLSCTAGQCAVTIREHAGEQCSDTQACPMDYTCATYSVGGSPTRSGQQVCWYAGSP